MQARAKPRAKTNALIGAVFVGLAAIIIAAVISVTSGTSTTSIWPIGIRLGAEPNVQQALVDVRAGEKGLLTPVQLQAVESRALVDIRAGEKAPVTETQVSAPVDKALILIRAGERESLNPAVPR